MSHAVDRIPVTLLTGFLGSGKTTLLNRLIIEPEMANSLVIINEFGSVGLDHDLIAHSNEDDTIVEMSSGCLCCTIKGDLQKTLRDAPWRYARDGQRWFDRVIIETTGLADPAPIIHTIMADKALLGQYQLAEIITLVDGINGAQTLDAQPEALKQAAVADTLIVSKTDLADPKELGALIRRLRVLNPPASILLNRPDAPDTKNLIGRATFNPELKSEQVREWLNEEAYIGNANAKHGHHDAHDDHAHDHHHDINRHDDRIQSVCLTLDEPLPVEVFDQWLDLLVTVSGVNMLRIKGLLNLKEIDKPLVIHGVQHIWHPPAILPEWPSDDRRSRIVFIMRDMGESDLHKALDFVTDRVKRAHLDGKSALQLRS
ncbi:CobW family GTP-binding protein [Qipengyuania sp. DGS5-3]|uniref:CobW family GTP-binding protein n=1 Tax=Qipengyuania sp. DGS5-3 TaxID=3349632 RepID=UPI0036D24A0C